MTDFLDSDSTVEARYEQVLICELLTGEIDVSGLKLCPV